MPMKNVKKERLEKEERGKLKEKACIRGGIANHHSALVPYNTVCMVVSTNLFVFLIAKGFDTSSDTALSILLLIKSGPEVLLTLEMLRSL